MTHSLAALLTQRSRQAPGGPALSIGRSEFSWADVHRISANFCHRLDELVGTRRVRIGVTTQSSPALPFLIWAAVLRDDDLLFLPAMPSAVQTQVEPTAISADLLFTDGDGTGNSDSLPLDQWFAEAAALPLAAAGTVAASPGDARASHGSFVFRTSGTEGEPKTVVTPYRHYSKVIDAMQACGALDHAKRQTCFISQPLFHSYGLCSYLEYVAGASHIILPKGDSPLGPIGELSGDSFSGRVTAVEGVPHFWALASKLARRIRAPHLRHLGIGGGRLDTAVIQELVAHFPGATVSVRYGLTETPSVVSHKVFRPPYPDDWHTSGKVVPAYGVAIRRDDGSPAAAGEEGEIIVSGECVAADKGVLVTGDLGFLSPEGELHITGRKSAFIKRRGYRLSPEPIESVLMQTPGLRDCRVRGEGEQLIAELVEDAPIDRRGLVQRLRLHLAAHCIPDLFVTVAEIPRTYSGKIKRGR